jgi:predicted nuclease of predicted toxin-antitoxin system
MKLCCDENIKRSITTILDQEGHDVVRVQDELDLGDTDRTVLEFCRETDRILLTNDDDFFDFETHPGILFLDEQRTSTRTTERPVIVPGHSYGIDHEPCPYCVNNLSLPDTQTAPLAIVMLFALLLW